ncbi:MAG: NTP transferase domain-containing protein [Oscillospiraceae bacterium]|nr:NTP transferase domain-containing protein [Oscillospiraceae bacterium]
MKAVILAGGEGRRLRPVTGESPKPLVPLLGRPVLEHILRLLRREGFLEVCATLGYRAQDIVDYFGDGSTLGISLQTRIETAPLGTAGSVKGCADFYGDEDFLVISGDAACDFALGELLRAHRESGAAVTLALSRSAEPLQYGLAVTDGEGLVRAFIEKPGWSRVVTDLVNTGIYVLSPRAMALVPEGQKFDFAKDLFPLLLQRGEKLLGVAMDGYWCDIGTPLAYYRCCADALEGKLRLEPGEAFLSAATPPAADENEPDGIDCPCRDRAKLMGTLSELFMELGADYADGLSLSAPRFQMHIRPSTTRSAIRIAVEADDAEFARTLALSARDVAQALDL